MTLYKGKALDNQSIAKAASVMGKAGGSKRSPKKRAAAKANAIKRWSKVQKQMMPPSIEPSRDPGAIDSLLASLELETSRSNQNK
jgi:hypothetical protein